MIDSMFKSHIELPGWAFILLMVLMFLVSAAFWKGVIDRKKYYIDGEIQKRGITIFNNTGRRINIAGFSIGDGELKNIGSPKELIDKIK